MKHMHITVQSSRYVLQTPWVSVREDAITFNGRTEPFYIIEQPECVSIVASTENGDVMLVRPYRYHTRAAHWELPSGYIEPGETPLKAAKRELYEETGLKAKAWRRLGWVYAKNDRSTARVFVFAATDLQAHQPTLQAEDKIVAARTFTAADIRHLINANKIVDSDTIAAFGIAWTQTLMKEDD